MAQGIPQADTAVVAMSDQGATVMVAVIARGRHMRGRAMAAVATAKACRGNTTAATGSQSTWVSAAMAIATAMARSCRLNTRITPPIAVTVVRAGDRTLNVTIMLAVVKAVPGSLPADSRRVVVAAGSAIARVADGRADDVSRDGGEEADADAADAERYLWGMRRRLRRVTLSHFQCKLRYVRIRPARILAAKAALFVLLALQLIVGLPLQTAYAATDLPVGTQTPTMAGSRLSPRAGMAPTPALIDVQLTGAQMPVPTAHSSTPIATAHADCPMHDASHGAAPAKGDNKHAPAGNHDCCHVSACQCQCLYTPSAFDLSPLAHVATSVVLPSLSSAPFVAPHIDDFLRPPIA